jgi:rhodanese-related sulfurtransferase
VVVDPRRDVDVYLDDAVAHGLRIERIIETLDPARPTVVYCASGYRSSIAASVLAAAGFGDVSDLLGGYEAWRAQHRSGPGRSTNPEGSEKELNA